MLTLLLFIDDKFHKNNDTVVDSKINDIIDIVSRNFINNYNFNIIIIFVNKNDNVYFDYFCNFKYNIYFGHSEYNANSVDSNNLISPSINGRIE